MNQEVKKKWIEDLRSGEYEQGHGSLNQKNKYFCCLGVLCDIHSKETGTPWVDGGYGDLYKYMESGGILPREVRDWAGLSSYNPVVCGRTLSSLNDRDLAPFEEIADLIEEYL